MGFFLPLTELLLMDYASHELYFSSQRMTKYFNSVPIHELNREAKAVEIYYANIILSRSFHPLISILEIALRNGINDSLCNYFGSNNWLREQKTGFMIDTRMVRRDYVSRSIISDNFFRERVQEVENRLYAQNATITHNKILSELSLGFWTKFFEDKPIAILKGKQLMAFKSGTRLPSTEVYEILNNLRSFRNRISHHEAICFNNANHFCLKKLNTTYFQIKEVLRWLGNDVRDWAEKFDTFQVDIKPFL